VEKNAPTFKYEKFTENMPKTLLEFFNKEISECPTDVIDTILQNQFNNYNDIITKEKLFQSIACQQNNNVFEKLKKEIENLNEETLSNVDGGIQALLAYYAKSPAYFIKSCDLLFKIAVFKNGNTVQSFFADLFTIFSDMNMANTYTPLPDKIDYLKNLIKLKKKEREILIILKAVEQGIQDPLHISKDEYDSTKIIVKFLRQFNFKDVELRYIDDLFKLTLRILGQSSSAEIIKKCNYIFNRIAFYLLQNNETFKVALNRYRELINTKKYNVFELIGSFNDAFRYNWIKELNEENISKLRIFYEDLKKTNKLTDLKIFCMQDFVIQDEEKEIFNNLVNNTNLEENEMLEFLFSDKSKLSFDVGIKEAAVDNNLSIFKKIIDKYVELKTPKNIDLIVGYFRGLYEKNQDTFDDITLRIDCKSPLYTILPDIINTIPTDKTSVFKTIIN
jgi:hypothetical protein